MEDVKKKMNCRRCIYGDYNGNEICCALGHETDTGECADYLFSGELRERFAAGESLVEVDIIGIERARIKRFDGKDAGLPDAERVVMAKQELAVLLYMLRGNGWAVFFGNNGTPLRWLKDAKDHANRAFALLDTGGEMSP